MFGAAGVGPGMAHSLGLHWGIPSGDPFKTTLLSIAKMSSKLLFLEM